jgi:uncharacterized membrane protein YeaQ/YmgE (transglycosylase-associated protein family)
MLSGIIGWGILGLLIGFIASKTINLRGDDPNIGILLAAFGAVIGGMAFTVFKGKSEGILSFWSMIVALVACGATLMAWHILRKHSLSRYR